MATSPLTERIADFERLLHDLEQRLAWLRRTAAHSKRAAPPAVEQFGETVAAALGEIAARVRGRASTVGHEAGQLGDNALHLGNDALRRLTREVEHRPLIMLAIAAGVGALAAGLFARRW